MNEVLIEINRKECHLNDTLDKLLGPTREQIIVWNQWAAVALDSFHENSGTKFKFIIDYKEEDINVKWDSDFSQDAMRETKNIAENGGISLALFVMSVLLDYKYLYQTEIGEGVDYGFQKSSPTSDNFLQDGHYVEISGLLQENGTNTLSNRIKIKHKQIDAGSRNNDPSSVIVTLFKEPLTVKEIHK